MSMGLTRPSHPSGTLDPEAGGLEAREGLALLRALRGLERHCADVVEVAPQYDPTTTQSIGSPIIVRVL